MPGDSTCGSREPVPTSDVVAPVEYWWRDDAACLSVDPAVFYDDQATSQAKAVCRACPVRDECLTEALARGERFGVWGGTDEEERRSLARSTHGTPERYQVGKCRCPACARAYAAKRAHTRELERSLQALIVHRRGAA
jgi:WhiB family redox-sensing transcriptional regulator